MTYRIAILDSGSVFGKLTAMPEYELRPRPDGRNRVYQRFTCECGNESWLVVYSVRSGNTLSCGCVHKAQVSRRMTTHGESKTSAYRVRLNKARREQKRAEAYGVYTETVTDAMLQSILSEFNNSCWICDVSLDEVNWDHVHPLSKGGHHVVWNLKPACRSCNSRKGNMHPFTDEMKTRIAAEVRALRTSQADLPVTDSLEVH
jgi:5-methylcytosine-specific restriction endonuclease McrA